jgi:hypothetical protein
MSEHTKEEYEQSREDLITLLLDQHEKLTGEIQQKSEESSYFKSQYEKIVVLLMRKSAEANDLRRELQYIRFVAEQCLEKGHNCCWVNTQELLKVILGDNTEVSPDPENVTPAEFALCCKYYIPEVFKVLTEDEKEMLEEIEKAIKKHLHKSSSAR